MTGWIAQGAGMLMLDKDGNGQLDNGTELFGDFTPLQNGLLAANGFQALSQFDANGDGWIDPSDPIFDQLKVWQYDPAGLKPTSGYNIGGALISLPELGIRAIGVHSIPTNQTDGSGNTETRRGSFEWTDGRTGTVGEYRFQRETSMTVAGDYVPVPEEYLSLPQLEGHGDVLDLHQAMARDSSGRLRALVEECMAETTPAGRADLFEQVLFKWTGVETYPNTGPDFMTRRRTAVLEKIHAEYGRRSAQAEPTIWKESYRRAFEFLYGSFSFQTHLADLYNLIRFDQNTPITERKGDLTDVTAELRSRIAADPVQGRQLLADFARALQGLGMQEMVDFLSFREGFIQEDPDLGWVIDSGGLDALELSSLYQGGTWNSEALRAGPTRGDGTIIGWGGRDVLYGSDANERLIHEGTDLLLLTEDAIIVGGGGNDEIWGGMRNDLLDGGQGNDLLYGGFGDDTYIFRIGSGQDTIVERDTTQNSADRIWLGGFLTPYDVHLARTNNDLVLTMAGSEDQLTAKDYFKNDSPQYRVERIEFSDGTVWGVDEIYHRASLATENADVLYGTPQDDSMDGLGGNDGIYGRGGNDLLAGSEGADRIYGEGGDDVLNGGPGNDLLVGGKGDDTYVFGRGHGKDSVEDFDDTAEDKDTVAMAAGVAPSEVAVQRFGDDLRLIVHDSEDELRVKQWFSNSSTGSTGLVESILFDDGTSWDAETIQQLVLQGTPQDDTLIGYDSDDSLDGKAGNDLLYGKTGNDTYVFGPGYGSDSIIDEDVTPGNVDTIRLTGQVTTSDVTLRGAAGNLCLFLNGSSDSLQVRDWFSGDRFKVEKILFSDGTEWDAATIQALASLPTDTDDYLYGTAEADVLDGGGGDDEVYGQEGDDILYGGTGFDYLEGEAGDDKLYGGEGDDELYSGYGVNELDGGPGYDYLYGNEGDNTYHVKRGGGFDSIEVRASQAFVQGDAVVFGEGISPEDLTIQFREADASTDGYGGYGGYGGYTGNPVLAIRIGEEEGALIEGIPSSDGGGYGGYGGTAEIGDLAVKRFVFADGTVLTLEEILARADEGVIGEQDGTYGSDFLRGSVADDTIYGGDGDDRIEGRDNNDYLSGDDYDDALSGGSGEDDIYGGGGDDVLAGGRGDDYLSDWQGNNVYAFNRGDGSDLIDAYPGSGEVDVLSFGTTIEPADIYGYVDSNGSLVLTVQGTSDQITTSWFDPYDNYTPYEEQALSRVQFIQSDGNGRVFDLAAVISRLKDSLLAATPEAPVALFTSETADLEILEEPLAGGDYALAYAQTGDLFAVSTYYYGGYEDDFITGGAGDDTIDAGDGDNTIFGEGGDDVITAGWGDDIINGGDGNDILQGGGWDDYLYGGAGDDTYIFNLGDGYDTIDDEATLLEPNTLVFGPGISPSSLHLTCDPTAGTFAIGIRGSGDQIELKNFDASDPYGRHAVEYFQFNSGTVLTYAQMIDLGFDLIGTSGEDVLTGTAADDRISGLEGNDTLAGGAGIDRLTGGAGDDTYLYNPGDGVAVIDDVASPSSGNTVFFGEGITLDGLRNRLSFRGRNLIIRTSDDGGEVRLTGFDPDAADTGPRAVQTFRFSDGQVLSYEAFVQNTFIVQGDVEDDFLRGTSVTDRLYGYEGSDRLEGGLGNDTLTGGAGDDDLLGGAGSDLYVFSPGDGLDTIEDTATEREGNLILFREGISRQDISVSRSGSALTIHIGAAGDAIRLLNFDESGQSGSPVVRAIEFADGSTVQILELLGTEGDDVINTGAGDDVLNGRGGHDTISTGEGRDTLVGGRGNDSLLGGPHEDTYVFNAGDGVDTIRDTVIPGEGNRVLFGEGIAPIDLSLRYEETELRVNVGSNGDAIVLPGFDAGDSTAAKVVDVFVFENSTEISYSDLVLGRGIEIRGTEGDDTLSGTNVYDRISGFDGNDIIQSGLGNDTVHGDGGDDTIDGGSGNDVLYGGDGNDIIVSGEGADVLDGGSGDDTLTTSGEDNVVMGGSGNDTLLGGAGRDVYHFGSGNGNDALYDAGGIDALLFDAGIAGEELLIDVEGNDLLLGLGDGSSIRIVNGLLPENGIESIQMGDGATLDVEDLLLPRISNFRLMLEEDETLSGALEVKDRSGEVSFLVTENTTWGGLAFYGDGTWQYAPQANFNGFDWAVVEVTNRWGRSTVSTIHLTVLAVNDAPVAPASEACTVGWSGTINGQIAATDVDGDVLGFSISEGPQHGTLTIDDNGTWAYQVEPSYAGSDQAAVIVADGNGGNATTLLSFYVLAVTPVVGDLDLSLAEDGSVSGALAVISAGGGELVYTVAEPPLGGVVELREDGTFTYTPVPDFNGTDQVLIAVTDVNGLSDTAALRFEIAPVNDAPVVKGSQSFSLFGTPSVAGQIEAMDVDGDALTYKVIHGPGNGTFAIDGEGRWSFSPSSGYAGKEQAVVEVEDGNGGRASSTLNFFVNVYEGGDQIIRGTGTESVALQGVSKDDLELKRQENDLRIDIRDKGSLTLEGYFAAPENGVGRLETEDGPLNLTKELIKKVQSAYRSWSPFRWFSRNVHGENGVQNLIDGSDSSDSLFGADESDVLFGERGNDSLRGKEGDDTLVGGEGYDSIWGNDGHDTLYGDRGSDTLFGNEGDDALIGGAENDYLNGDGGHDRLFGDGGNDVLNAGSGNDMLSGGSGADVLLGGAGDDTYRFKPGDGRDVVKDSQEWWCGQQGSSGIDRVQFREGVTREDVALFMKWGKLYVQYGEADVVEIYGQQSEQEKIERFELADGRYLTDADVNRVIQDMACYAVNEGICLQSVEDVRRNDELMTLIAGSWKQG